MKQLVVNEFCKSSYKNAQKNIVFHKKQWSILLLVSIRNCHWIMIINFSRKEGLITITERQLQKRLLHGCFTHSYDYPFFPFYVYVIVESLNSYDIYEIFAKCIVKFFLFQIYTCSKFINKKSHINLMTPQINRTFPVQ